VAPFIAKLNKKDLLVRRGYSGGDGDPVMDRRHDLNQMPAALTHMGEGHAKGEVVVRA